MTAMRSRDTSPEAHAVHLQLLRAMSPERRIKLVFEVSDTLGALAADGIKSRHPEYDDDQVTWALRRQRLGDDLFCKAWPEAPLLGS